MSGYEKLELQNVPFYAVHPTNPTSIRGMLPQDKSLMLDMIDNTLKYSNTAILDSFMGRSTLFEYLNRSSKYIFQLVLFIMV